LPVAGSHGGKDRRLEIAPRDIAKASARIADELKATDIVVMDVRKLSDVTDYFVICTGNNRRQLRAIQRKLSHDLTPPGSPPPRAEGEEGSAWILLDFYDVVVHLFDPEAREFYDLELLWGDAPRVTWARKRPKG